MTTTTTTARCDDEVAAGAAARWLAEFEGGLKDGRAATDADRLEAFRVFAESGHLGTTEPLLPLLLNLKGKPYTLAAHAPFGPLFRTTLPAKTVIKAGRQLSKSTSQAAAGILFANSVRDCTTLYVTPLFEQIRRFSTNYVGDFINNSPVKRLWSDASTANNVLQRSFLSNSKMIFSFALLNVDRIRGISADIVAIDEIQNIDKLHVPIIEECMSYSEWKVSRYSGTPLTLDNTIEGYWQRSSQAEWVTRCAACGHDNIASNEYDLQAMIGPWHEDVGPGRPGTVCGRCRRPVDPGTGRWFHRYPERRWDFAGFHVPQVVMPHHYASAKAWGELTAKQAYMAPGMFNNEVLGESYDVGSKLVTLTELRAAACLPWANRPDDPDPEVAERLERGDYPTLVMGVDWGGGGKDEVSYTTLALLGRRSDGVIDVLWAKRLLTPHDHVAEAGEVRRWLARFRPHFLVHDYTGAGALRETMLYQGGLPLEKIMPVAYVGPSRHSVLAFVPASRTHPRDHFRADKSRSLLYTSNCLKLGWLRTFAYDYVNDERPGLLHDFLALIDEKVETHRAGDIYMVKKQDGFSDDFAHAVNLGCLALWHANDSWPDFAHMAGFASLTQDQLVAATGRDVDDDEAMMGGYFAGP